MNRTNNKNSGFIISNCINALTAKSDFIYLY